MLSDEFKRISARIDAYAQEAIEIEKRLTAIPALGPENGGDGEEKKAAYIAEYLANVLNCKDIWHINAPDKRVSCGYRPNIIARFPGTPETRMLWIMAHMDVVPPGDLEKWQSDPWEVKVKDGKVYGRGTEDNQQGLVSALLATKAFIDEGILPKVDIGLIFAADEETGSGYGLEYVLQHHANTFSKNDLIIIPDAGNADGTLLEVAEKSIAWYKFTVKGKQTHGSTPEQGINAFRAASNLVVTLDNLYSLFPKNDPVFEPPISTFEPTKKEANVPNVNTVPGEDIFYLDCRVLPCYALDDVTKQVENFASNIAAAFNVTIKVEKVQYLKAPDATPGDAPVVRAVQRALKELRNIEPAPMGIGGGTVAAFFRSLDFPAVVWATQDETLHGPNEYVRISNILEDAKVFAHVALQSHS